MSYRRKKEELLGRTNWIGGYSVTNVVITNGLRLFLVFARPGGRLSTSG